MEYATQKEDLILAEYGRHVQDMVQHTMTITDRQKRSDAAETIISVMTQLHPSYKGSDELQQKLWEDLFIISGYTLDVDCPYPKPEPKVGIVAEKVDYPNKKFKFKHYGKIIEGLIEAAVKLEKEDERQELTQHIANLMKRSYLNFNRDSVNDDMIVDQLTSMSEGKLKLDAEFKFHHTNDILKDSPKRSNNSNNKGKGRGKRKWKK